MKQHAADHRKARIFPQFTLMSKQHKEILHTSARYIVCSRWILMALTSLNFPYAKNTENQKSININALKREINPHSINTLDVTYT